MSPIWSRTDGANGPSLSIIFSDGEVALIGKEHVNLALITLKLAEGIDDSALRELIHPAKNIAARFKRLSERITTDGVNILLDGDVINDGLTDYILELIRLENEGEDAPSWKPFVNFLEKLSQNSSKDSRESLFDFIQKWGLTIRNDGDIIAYKGIKNDYGSVQQGPGIVNNVRIKHGSLDNKPGNLVEIERSYVEANRDLACAQGLHVTTVDYASGWGPRVVTVAINPRDVVAVPRQEIAKMRVCRYEVIADAARKERTSETITRTAPVWGGAQHFAKKSEASPELLKKLEKAIKNKRQLRVSYRSLNSRVEKDYLIEPKRIDGDILHLTIPGVEHGTRTFIITSISSAKKVETKKEEKPAKVKKAKKAKAEKVVTETVAVKIVRNAIEAGELVTIDYKPSFTHTKTYLVKPLSIEEGKLRLLLPSNGNVRRDFLLEGIEAARPHQASKKNKGKKKK